MARWAASKEMVYDPAAQLATDWAIEPSSWRKATCDPCGADGLPWVNTEPLPARPEPLRLPPEKIQAEPVGL